MLCYQNVFFKKKQLDFCFEEDKLDILSLFLLLSTPKTLEITYNTNIKRLWNHWQCLGNTGLAEWVKDTALLQLWHRSQPRNSIFCGVAKKKKKAAGDFQGKGAGQDNRAKRMEMSLRMLLM